jgi:hypothetical protein
LPACHDQYRNLTETNEYRSGVGAHWPFSPTRARSVQKDLDIANTPILSSADRLWKIFARTCVLSSRSAGRTGTSQRPN